MKSVGIIFQLTFFGVKNVLHQEAKYLRIQCLNTGTGYRFLECLFYFIGRR